MILTWLSLSILGLAAFLLIIFSILLKDKMDYPIRQDARVSRLVQAHIAAIERQEHQNIFLGQHLFCPAYPGVGLDAIAVLPAFLDSEIGKVGGMSVSGGDGSLVVLAREIIAGRYRAGFNHQLAVTTPLYGPTPLSLTPGILSEIHDNPHHLFALFGSYGPEVLTTVSTARRLGGHIFAAGGSIISQATLFANVEDVLIGEEIFILPGLLMPKTKFKVTLLTEDILRILLMAALIIAVILKMVSIL